MAHFGVKVTPQIQGAEVAAEDLQRIIQAELDKATERKPITVSNFKAKVSGKQANRMRSDIQTALGTATTKSPIQVTGFIAKVSAKERDAMLKTVREKMENAGVVLKIKEINANSAVERLRKDLEKMLSGLQITGLKEFVGADGMTAAMEKAADSAERQAAAFERSQKAAKGIKANTQMLSNLKLVTSSISRGLFGISDESERADMQAQAAQILKDIEAAASKAGDEQERLIELITQSVQRLRDQADAQKERQKEQEAYAAAVKKAGSEEALQAARQKKEDDAKEAAAKKEIANMNKVISLKSRMQTWIQNNTRAYQANKSVIDALMDELQSSSGLTASKLEEIRLKFNGITNSAKQSGIAGSSFFEKLAAGWEKFGNWSIVTKSLTKVYELVRNIKDAVLDVDAAMTELKKVTDLTDTAYEQLKDSAAGMAREIGASVADTINSVADFSRLGFDIEGATALAEAALVYKNVGDGIDDISVASESLISTIKAFSEIAPEDAMSIVDKFNEVGNSFAISSVGIGDALQRSAAALAGAGNTIDQSIGMITAMNEIVQDPDVVGTAMKTLSLYLRAAKVDAEEAGIATDGMANSVSELRNDLLALTGQRIDIMIDENTFKSTYQIMKELSEIWGTLTDIDQAAILELIGGKRNANTISSLLMNFETAIAATESAADSLGSAMQENEVFLDSIGGKINQLKSSFEAFSNSVVNNGIVKALLSIATVFVDLLTTLSEIHLLLPAIGVGLTAFVGNKFTNSLAAVSGSIQDMVNAGKDWGEIGETLHASFSGLSNAQKKLAISAVDAALQEHKLTDAERTAVLQQAGLITSTNLLDTSTKKITLTWKAFVATLSTPVGIITAITTIISLVSGLKQAYDNAQQAAIDHANAIKDTYNDAQKTAQNNIDVLEGLKERYNKLSSGVDDHGKNVSLTADEYAEYRDIIEQVADLAPDMVKGYGEEGAALDSYIDVIDRAIEAQERYRDESEKTYLASGYTLFNANKSLYKDATKDMLSPGRELGDFLQAYAGDYGDGGYRGIWKHALEGIGIDNNTFESLGAAEFAKIYENAAEFMHLIRTENEKLGLYLDEDLDDIEMAVNGLGNAWKEMYAISTENAKFLVNHLFNSVDLGDGLKKLPLTIHDELAEGLADVIDPNKGFDIQRDAAVSYIEELCRIMESEAGERLSQMHAGLADGSVSIEEYNAAVAALGEEWANNPALSVAIAFFEGFSNSAKKAAEDSKILNTEVASLSSTLKASKQNQDVLNQALDEMNSTGGISNDTLSTIEGLLTEEEKLTDYIELQNGKLTLNEQAWKDRNAAMWQKDLDGLINQNTLLGEENKALEAQRTAAQAYIDQGDMYNPSEHGGYEWKSTDEAKIALEGYTKQIELNTTAQRENWQEYTLRRAAMQQEGVEIQDVVGEIQSATSLAKNASDAIIDARSDLDKYGKLQPETISAISSILGEEAANIKDYVGEVGEAFNEDLFKGFVEGKIGEYGAEIDVVRDSLIEMLNVDTSTNPFDAITTAMENVRKAASIYESAQQDMLSDSGMLSEGTITALQTLFEEDWLSYVEEVPDGKGYTLLGDKLTQFAQTELTTANATEALLATMMALFVDVPDTTKLDQISRALNGIGQAGNLASTIATELAENGTNSLNTLSSLIDFVGNDFVDNMGEYVTFTDKGFELSANAVETYATKMIEDLVGVDDELKKLYKDRLEDAVKTQVEIAKIASTIGNVGSVGGLIHNIHQELSEDGTNSLDTLASFIEAYGEGWEAQVDWTNGIEISTSALRDNIVEQIEATAKTEDQKYAMIDALDATIALEKANESLSESYSGIKNVISSIGSMGGGAEIGIDLYEQMIAQDKRYAAAVEYQNGVMTINRDLFDQVTAQIIKETQARALQQIALLETDKRYQELIEKQKEFALTDEELGYVNGIEAQIMGWGVLAQEIENANSALNRFMNADNEAGASSYNQAKAAAEMIDNVLHNKKSEWYGREGEEKYLEAKNFLIRPDIDMSLAEKSIKRYVTDDNSGINRFIDDLIKFDFMKVTDNGAMMVDVDLDAIAKKLNLTVEGVRALIDEYNTFGEQKIEVTPSVDTGDVEGGTEKTSALMTTAQNAKQALADVNAEGELIKTKITEIGDMSLTVNTSPANSAVSGLIDNLSGVISKINAINNMRISISASTSTGSSLLGGITSLFSGGSYGTSAAGGTEASSGGKTLVGEVGPEIVVDPNKNRWYVVGKNGAEFVMLPKNAIVFDAAQSGKLLKSGKAGGYGEAMASGSFDPTKIPGYYDKDEDIDFVDTRKQNVTINNDIDVVSSAAPTTQQVLDAIGDVVNGTGLKTNVGTSTKKKTSGSGSSSSSSSAKEEKTELEKLQEKYEEINSLTEHLIEHQEHLYSVAEKGMDLGAMEKSLEEQARLYRQIMEDSQKAVSDMRAAGATDADEELQAMEEAYWSAYESLYDTLDQINSLYVDSLNEKIDSIQGAYDTLKQAADEFSSDGGISVDTFQKLLENGVQYMDCLEKVNGQYIINEEAIQKMIAAEKDQLAVETALSYLNQVKEAIQDGEYDRLSNLTDMTNQMGDATWRAVFAQAELLKGNGLDDEQYQIVINNLNAIKDLANTVITDVGEGSSGLREQQESAFEKIINYVQELIKYETKEQIEAIEEQIDAYKKVIDLRKEALKTAKDENDYTKSVAEKTKEIAEIQARIDQLSLDSSRSAQAERIKLMEELAALQDELGETQEDHAYDLQIDALDKQAEAYEESRQPEIDALENSISSAEKLYQLALDRVETGWDTLYGELIAWNTEAGNVLNEEIVANWEKAIEAVQTYGSVAGALGEFIIPGAESSRNNVVADTNMPKYHKGGVVGNEGEINEDEVVAILEKGEIVINDGMKKTLYKIIDFASYFSEKLGTAIGHIQLPSIVPSAVAKTDMISAMPTGGTTSNVFSPSIQVSINHNGQMTDRDALSYGKRIANTAMEQLRSAFEQRGMNAPLSTLRP